MRAPAARLRPVLIARRRGRPVAAVLSKFCTAAGSFALQATAAHVLGAAGLGTFAVAYSVLLMVAAASNGLVGDSLTALRRDRPEIRVALSYWCGLNAVAGAVLGSGFLVLTGALAPGEAALLAVVSVVFVIETVVRRLLQAAMLFWSSVLVELAGSIGSLVALAGWALLRPLDLGAFIVALGAGQVVAIIAALPCLPASERWLPLRGPAAMAEVAGFGFWRAGQQAIRPAVLTAVRSVIFHFSGRAMLGQLEAARVYMSPALLAVQGFSTYLFSSYAVRRDAPVSGLITRADRAVLGLGTASVLAGVVGTALFPWVGDLITGGQFPVSAAAVFGWAVYAAAAAAVTPYQSLAAARGRQALVTLLRAIDAVLGLLACVPLLALGVSPTCVPYVLAAGSCLGGLLIRSYALLPLAAAEAAAEPIARPPERTGRPTSPVFVMWRRHRLRHPAGAPPDTTADRGEPGESVGVPGATVPGGPSGPGDSSRRTG